jgi:hypothetical protein
LPTRGNLGGGGDRFFDVTEELLEIIPTLDDEEKRNKE